MASAAEQSKKHRLRSKNEVVQLNDFFEELNEEYEEELRMRQTAGAAVDETALLGDREVPFQFVEEENDEDSDGADESDDDASESDAASSEAPNASSSKLKRSSSGNNAKVSTQISSPATATSKPELDAVANNTAATKTAAAPATSSAPVKDAVEEVQRSTSFASATAAGGRGSVVLKLKSFWEKLGDEPTAAAPAKATPGRSPSLTAETVSPAPQSPITPTVSSPVTPATPATPSGGSVKKWAPVQARPALAMAISVPGDRSIVARTMSIGPSPSTPTKSPSASSFAAASPSVAPASQPGPQQSAPPAAEAPVSAVSPIPIDTASTNISQNKPAPEISEKTTEKPSQVPAEHAPTEQTVEAKPTAENVVPIQDSKAAEPLSTPNTVATTEEPATAEPTHVEQPVVETASNIAKEEESISSGSTDSIVAEPAPAETKLPEDQKQTVAETPAEPLPSPKARKATKSLSRTESGEKRSVSRSDSAESSSISSATVSATNSPAVDKKKKRTSEKRRRATEVAEVAPAPVEPEALSKEDKKDKEAKRLKKSKKSASVADLDRESTDPNAPEKVKRRRKKLTATSPGSGAPSPGSVSPGPASPGPASPTKKVPSKKIKKTMSAAPDANAGSAAPAAAEAAGANSNVQAAPKEIDKLKQFFGTWHAKDLMHTWEIDPTEIEFIERIGEGTSCSVYRGTYRGQEVALKVLKEVNQKQLNNFTKEFDIISQFRSPYVVFFFGACIEPVPVMVLGYARKGSLFTVLNNPNENITWELSIKICLQTLRGLDSLHNWRPQIVHRDLKSRNILVEDDWNTKLCDFGESRYTQGANLETLCKVRGTYAYIAPEVYFGQSFTTKSDVYAFGIILWELCNRCVKGRYETPFSEFKSLIYDFQIIVQASRKGLRPSIDPKVPQALQNVIRCCWDHEPENRPTTSQLLHFFEEIAAEPSQKKWLEVKHAMAWPPAGGAGKPGAPPKQAGAGAEK